MKKLLSSLALFGLLIASTAMAVPMAINIQGHLSNNGVSMNGNHPVIFRLYDAATGGNELWNEPSTITVDNFLYNSIIGEVNPLPSVIFSQQLWLEATVDGEVLMPRIKLASVPTSIWSQRADTALVALNGVMSGGQWETNGTDVWRATGSIGLGTMDPLSIAWFGNPAHVVSGVRPTVSLSTTQTSGLATLQFSGPTPGSQFHVNYVDATQPFVDFGSNLRIYNGGNVGIGTVTPSTRLEVKTTADGIVTSGSTPVAGFRLLGTTFGNTVLDMGIGAGGVGNNTWLQATDRTDLNQKYVLSLNPNGGNVGIGLTNPSTSLDMVGNLKIRLQPAGDNSGMSFNVAPESPSIGFHASDNSQRFTIATNITTSNPSDMMRFQTSWVGDALTIQGDGTIHIPHNLNVSGTKCRVVMTVYGQLKMNAVESTHALFMDDVPSARLVNGKCRVNLSPKFLATVTVNGKYPLAVNVTFYEPHDGGWYVQRDATGFTVIDPSGSNAEISWQAFARQQGYEDVYLDPVETTTAQK